MVAQIIPMDSFKQGTSVWISDDEFIWIDGILEDSILPQNTQFNVQIRNGEVRTIKMKNEFDLPHLKNPDILIGRDDLTSLSYLHEPAVLYNLNYRFATNQSIYTYCGIVLVAINPYRNLPQLYGNEMIQVYRGVGSQVRTLDPHIYAVSEEAYFDLKEYHKNQSIIVSGESGAGKTVSAKLAMKYFAGVAHNEKSASGGIEDRVLASNPIMEAIGNARTIRNDNSSRFGKFIQINFNHKFNICGAEMKTYLLEKSRVVYQAQRERNYHIFYQLCASRSQQLLNGLNLDTADKFQYLSSENSIDGVNDFDEFQNTLQALNLLDFTIEHQRNIVQTLAAILHMGNISFEDENGESSSLQNSCSSTLNIISSLLRIDESNFRNWLCKKEIRAANEIVVRNLNNLEAVTSRDALSKMLYSTLFNWIVNKINSSLKVSSSPIKQARNAKKEEESNFIGVLDIYGFETFDVNSFEQFCINYANEKLQQQFNEHVFKLEQEEYFREGIEWVKIEFYDNQSCINLIESRLGIIDLLDEQSKVGRGSDFDWLQQMKCASSMKNIKELVFPKIRDPSFIIKHFAADVNYQVNGFMDKNKDTISEQLIGVLKESQFSFLSELLHENEEKKMSNMGSVGKKASGIVRSVFGGSPGGSAKKTNRKTVASQFRDSLHSLMLVLKSTRPHYIRCIKPNDTKSAFTFESHRAMQQLRACGVLETVRLSAAGYPSRWSYDEFGRRYRVLYLGNSQPLWRDKTTQFAELVCKRWINDDTKYALGHTKIFFRTGEVAKLERIRGETLATSAVRIQKTWRGHKFRKAFLNIRNSVIAIQAFGRAYLAYRRLQYLRMHRAVILMQSCVRKFIHRQRFMKIKIIALEIQNRFRAKIVREQIRKLRFEKTVTNLQRYCRGFLGRREFKEYLQKIITVQCCVRKYLARKQFKRLKIEAKSVNKLQSLNKGLENKIFELQKKLDSVSAEKATIQVFAENLQNKSRTFEKTEAELKIAMVKLQEIYGVKESLENELRDREIILNQSKEDLAFAIDEIEIKQKDLDTKNAEQKVSIGDFEELNKQLKELQSENETLHEEMQQVQTNLRHKETELEGLQYVKEMLLNDCDNRLNSEYSSPGLSRVNSMRLPNGTPLNSLDKSFSSASTVILNDDVIRERDETQLILKLQEQLTRFRQENERLRGDNRKLKSYSELKTLLDRMAVKGSLQSYEQHRAQEAEVAYLKLRQELDRMLSEKVKFGIGGVNFQRLLDSNIEETERRREESIELRALLASKFETSTEIKGRKSMDNNNNSRMEEEICWERQCREQKRMIEDLMEQLEEKDETIEEIKAENCDLKQSTRRKSLVPQVSNDSGVDDVTIQGEMRNELHRLVSENMVLQNKLDKQNGMLVDARSNLREVITGRKETSNDKESRPVLLSAREIEHSAILNVKQHTEFARIIVSDLKPRMGALILPCLPSLLYCMSFRHCDNANDEFACAKVFNSLHTSLKEVLNRSHDLDVLALWLVNSWRLLNLLRQYSRVGDDQKEWKSSNSEIQNSQVLQKLDLGPVREQLSLRVKENYNYFMKRAVEPVLTPKIVPAILQHEAAKSDFDETNSANNSKTHNQRIQERAFNDLTELMNFMHAKLRGFGADDILLNQVFAQLIKWICAYALNHLMFRRELCNFERAMQIKHNVQQLSSWLSDRKMTSLKVHLEPLIQASHLLQSRKDDQYIDTLLGDLTSLLKPKQIITLLRHYNPAEGFEPEMGPDFMNKLSERMSELRGNKEEQNVLLMATHIEQFDTQPFVYTQTQLEKVNIPQGLRIKDNVAELI